MQRKCKKALKIRKMSFIAAVFKNGSVKARERKVQRSTPRLMIQSIDFSLCVWKCYAAKNVTQKKEYSLKHKLNVRILKVGQIKDDFRVWAQATGAMVTLSMVIQKGGNEKEIKSPVLAILNLSCREDSPEEMSETNRFF